MQSCRGDFPQGALQFRGERSIFALNAASAADEDMVGPGDSEFRQRFAGEGTEAALHAIADDGAADFLGDGETDSLGRVAVLAVSDEQDESRGCRAPAGVRSEEIRAFLKRD